MGCSFSGLNALYDNTNGGGDVWINENRFRILKPIGQHVFLVKEVLSDPSNPVISKKFRDPSHVSGDGTYTMKKVLIQSKEQLELVKEEIRVSSLFSHPNLLPLLDHAIISVKASQDQSRKQEAYLLFPVHLDGTLLDSAKAMKAKKEFFSTLEVLQIFLQLCSGLKHMHNFDPTYAHNDVKPGNVLLTHRKGQATLAKLMEFGNARLARRQIRSRSEALQLQEWASEHVSAPFRAPELWDCPSHCDIDERTDIWSLGCTLFAIIMRNKNSRDIHIRADCRYFYCEVDFEQVCLHEVQLIYNILAFISRYGVSPFEYALEESDESPQLAIVKAQIKWPTESNAPYPNDLNQFVTWMLQPQPTVRPRIDDIIIHVDKLISKYSH